MDRISNGTKEEVKYELEKYLKFLLSERRLYLSKVIGIDQGVEQIRREIYELER